MMRLAFLIVALAFTFSLIIAYEVGHYYGYHKNRCHVEEW